jgi:hypothetical protein
MYIIIHIATGLFSSLFQSNRFFYFSPVYFAPTRKKNVRLVTYRAMGPYPFETQFTAQEKA